MKYIPKCLVACEESQAVTKYLRELGIEAYSCDLLPTSGDNPEWHLQADVVEILKQKWDAIIAFPPCFEKSTLITTDKGLIPISEIKEGDLVLTHTGSYKKVYRTMSKVSNHYRLLKSSNNLETVTTDEHPYFVRIRKNRKDLPAEFIKAEELNNTFFTGSVYSKNFIKTEYSDEILYLMGRYVADGHLRKNRTREDEYEEMTISVGKNKLDIFKKEVNSIKFREQKERTVVKAVFCNYKFCKLFEQFGKGAENKQIPQWVVDLPKEQLRIFLKGYLDGDGYIAKNVTSCSTISKKLAIQIGIIMSKVYNRPYSIYKAKSRNIEIEGRSVFCKELYTIKINTSTKIKHNYTDENYVWGKVLKNERVEELIQVYNISVEGDESYIANGVIVHNCTDLAVSGARHFERKIADGSQAKSIDFFMMFANADCDFIAIENPIGIMSSRYRKPDQIIQPWQFGDKAQKSTCLWLKGFPLLEHTDIVEKGEFFEFTSKKGEKKRQPMWYYKALQEAKTPQQRSVLRSKTFDGIAKAVGHQWGEFLIKNYN